MTIEELRNTLDKYNDQAPVVCYNANGDLVDIFIESIIVQEQNVDNRNQRSHEKAYSGGVEAMLITVDPPRKRF